MKKNNISKRLKERPYRGIISEIAKEENLTRQAIWAAINKYENVRIIQIAINKMEARRADYDQIMQRAQAC